MDIGRYPALRKARVHAGDGAPVVDLLWYVTHLTKCVDVTIINRREWDLEKYVDYPVGELARVGPYRDFAADGGPRLGLTGNHQCHPEWMAAGEPWPPSLPDTVYDSDDIPACCGRVAPGALGGLMLGGSAGDVFIATDATAGGLELGRLCTAQAHADGAAGGLALGGAAGDLGGVVDATAGGLALGGSAGDQFTGADATAGGLEVGGMCDDIHRHPDATAGGLALGGSAGDLVPVTDATAGGLALGGSAGDLVYARNYDVGSPFGVTLPTLVADTTWQAAVGGFTMRLTSPIGTGGDWILRWFITGTDPIYTAPASWNGTGTQSFTPDPANPVGYTDPVDVSAVV